MILYYITLKLLLKVNPALEIYSGKNTPRNQLFNRSIVMSFISYFFIVPHININKYVQFMVISFFFKCISLPIKTDFTPLSVIGSESSAFQRWSGQG